MSGRSLKIIPSKKTLGVSKPWTTDSKLCTMMSWDRPFGEISLDWGSNLVVEFLPGDLCSRTTERQGAVVVGDGVGVGVLF